MSVLTVTTFLGLLSLATLVGVAGVAVLWILDKIGVLAGGIGRLRGTLGTAGLWLAFAVAATSMAGSLYLSEVAGFVPCVLCWYQRIAMYPLAVIIGIAAIRGDRSIYHYAIPVAAIGAAISAWHIGVQRLPGLPSGSCSLDVPCSAIYVEVLGFITIPTMALAGFLGIVTLLLLMRDGGDDTELE